jgi:DNA-binding PadR family transcriptional regulator
VSPTRLLILGAVRIFQPVHGYFVRRELLSWHADAWAHLNPGSVYNALRTLAREGFLAEVGTEAHGGRPARTTYRLTADGETEFLSLLREALWDLAPYEPANLLAAWSFAHCLRREEVLEAFEHRVQQIDAWLKASEFTIEDLGRDPAKPPQVHDHVRLIMARLHGEAQWTRALLERIRAGELWFSGEQPEPPWRTSDPRRTVGAALDDSEPTGARAVSEQAH